jgi:glycosyltransferase A (GT-A) superfamily protein (DUF2064 family)
MTASILMIAARVPTPGETKTRLGQTIGMDEAASLYACFLQDLATHLLPAIRAKGIAIAWTYSPPDADFAGTLDDLGIGHDGDHLVPQDGEGWAVRQDTLHRWASGAGYDRAVLIASDSPHLPADHVLAAFAALETSHVVIGRVLDGGYYAIGMRGYRDILRDVPMSTASAADALIANAESHGLAVAEVPATFDVDIADDVSHLISALAPDGGVCPRTWALLGELGLR